MTACLPSTPASPSITPQNARRKSLYPEKAKPSFSESCIEITTGSTPVQSRELPPITRRTGPAQRHDEPTSRASQTSVIQRNPNGVRAVAADGKADEM